MPHSTIRQPSIRLPSPLFTVPIHNPPPSAATQSPPPLPPQQTLTNGLANGLTNGVNHHPNQQQNHVPHQQSPLRQQSNAEPHPQQQQQQQQQQSSSSPSPTPFSSSQPLPPQTGSITCTLLGPKIYLLSILSPPDNRLTPALCAALLLALDIIEYRHPRGCVVTTSAIEKFYSNGLDYEEAIRTKGFFEGSLYPLWRRVLTYPMPTIALLNGHAFAGGLMLAMMHDYRLMNPHKGFVCLNELDFGASLTPPMASIFRQKLPKAEVFRTMVLESRRLKALEALEMGIVDGLGGVLECKAYVEEMRLVSRGETGSYGRLKEVMWGETVGLLEKGKESEGRGEERRGRRERERVEEAKRRVEAFERERIVGGRGSRL
ncbi:hypothetical protein MMC25_001676 [Agyrium rufum]|nr:hypothetical protein [Agyrium rufum]